MELGNLLFGHSRGAYDIERFPAQDYFSDFFEKVGLDYHGHPRDGSPLLKYVNSEGLIDTPMFSLFPYYWGEDEEYMAIPNFVFKPSDIEIRWYKYPLRDSYSNVELSADQIGNILYTCAAYVDVLKELDSREDNEVIE